MAIECASLFRVVSEVNRRRVLAALYNRELSVQELQTVLVLGQSTISAHLAQLKLNGLVDSRRSGRFVLYRLAFGSNELIDSFIDSVIRLSSQEAWYEKDDRKINSFLLRKKEATLSFYEGVDTQNKRSPGQTDFALSIGLMRSIRNKRIVDIGCGTGNLVKEFSYLNKSVIGIDIEAQQIEIAKQMHLNAETKKSLSFLVASGEDTKQKPDSTDLVIFSHSLHHIKDPRKAIAEAYRILDNRGVVIILDLHKHEETWMKEIYGDIHLGFGKTDIEELLGREHFQDVRVDLHSSDLDFPQFETLIATAIKINK